MSVFKRKKVWYYKFQIRGVPYYKSIPEAQNKQQATKAEAQAKNDVFEGRYGRPTGEAIFMEYALDVYLPWAMENKRSGDGDGYKLKSGIKRFFGRMSFAQITPMVLERFKRQRLATETLQGRSRQPASVNRDMALISKIFTLAIRDGIAVSNPCEKVSRYSEHNRRTRYLTADEESKLLAQLVGSKAHLRPLVIIAINTGMRRGEILNLRWQDIDYHRQFIHVPKSKTGSDRYVPMNQAVIDELKLMEAKADPESVYLFVTKRTGKTMLRTIAFDRAVKEAGLVNFHFHDLRHTFATRLGEQGADVFTIAQILGHSDVRMTGRYTHSTESNLRNAVRNLEGYGENRKNVIAVADVLQAKKVG